MNVDQPPALVTYRNILKFIKIGSNCFPLVWCARNNLGTSCFPFLHLNHFSFPYFSIQPVTNNGIIFIPAPVKFQMKKTISTILSNIRFQNLTMTTQNKSLLPIRNSVWITSNTLFTECWKSNTVFNWVVNITSDVFLLQNNYSNWIMTSLV